MDLNNLTFLKFSQKIRQLKPSNHILLGTFTNFPLASLNWISGHCSPTKSKIFLLHFSKEKNLKSHSQPTNQKLGKDVEKRYLKIKQQLFSVSYVPFLRGLIPVFLIYLKSRKTLLQFYMFIPKVYSKTMGLLSFRRIS